MVNESANIKKNAQKTSAEFDNLTNKYGKATNELTEKLKEATIFKEKSDELFGKARKIVVKVTKTQQDIDELRNSPQEDELKRLEGDLQSLIDKMNIYTGELEQRVQHYKTCN